MPVIKIEDIAHVRFAAPDLAAMRAFLEDFGMTVLEANGRLYGKGGDGRAYIHVTEPGNAKFLGIGLRAESFADLDKLATVEGVALENLEEPGGGKILRLIDPHGYRVEVVAGQAKSEPSVQPVDPARNTAAAKGRLGAVLRLEPAPAHVRRIGHAVLKVRDFRRSEAWYKDRFGFLTSDEVEAAKDVPLGAFMRCDRGNKRAPNLRATIDMAIMMGRLVCMTSKWSAFLRDMKFKLGRALGKLPDRPADYPPISAGAILPGSAAAGQYFPQFISTDGLRLDDALGAGHWLISRGELSAPKLAPFAASFVHWLDSYGAEAVLVRPDRYVFGTGPLSELEAAWRAATQGEN